MTDSKAKYQEGSDAAADAPASQQQQQQQRTGTDQLDFVVRPRFGNRYQILQASGNGQQPQRESVALSSVYAKIATPATQVDALRQLGIQMMSRTRVKLDLQEFPPNYSANQKTHGASTADSAGVSESMELRATFNTRNPVIQPIEIKVSYMKDAYIEADTAFCCLLEANTPYGDSYSIPVLGRGSFSYLGDSSSEKAAVTAAQREHCITGASASFLQRAALSLSTLLCLCELSKEDDKMVIDFYRDVDQTFGYGFGPYLDYLVYCCQTSSQHRDTYLKYLCLEWNNSFTKDRITEGLKHFMDTRRPTQRYFQEVQTVMSQEELERDRKLHHSIKGKAAKASMYIKNAGRQHMPCCPCHVM